MEKLNFPQYTFSVRDNGTHLEIFCKNRRKWLKLTPEEWVRQHTVEFLTDHCKVKPELVANEMALPLNGMTKRCDTVVFNNQMKPILLCEYKAPHITISQKVFDQIFSYNRELGVPMLLITNGLNHVCIDMRQEPKFISILDLPKTLTELQ